MVLLIVEKGTVIYVCHSVANSIKELPLLGTPNLRAARKVKKSFCPTEWRTEGEYVTWHSWGGKFAVPLKNAILQKLYNSL